MADFEAAVRALRPVAGEAIVVETPEILTADQAQAVANQVAAWLTAAGHEGFPVLLLDGGARLYSLPEDEQPGRSYVTGGDIEVRRHG
jgi:hypothetical protein